ncbi:uncharacterized protein LOC130625246 [Hydractinia symbiolongicarpus]|uniref:uncharacterized protein LOC130625246 n=1 Tax=Hydractinia symbiolongicarpus TaxID=13093 RepID=UPI00254AC910|nr:uncharacterized protein LOC130625246 [Hydractinia symbiolongicarpus]
MGKVMQVVSCEPVKKIIEHFRMSPSTFEELLSFVSPAIIKQHTAMQDPVGPSERLSVTLRYLLAKLFLNMQIYLGLADGKKFIEPLSTEQEWITISKEFELKWNFPHALGALDAQ